ncbi:MAG: hypothetical protein AAGD06_23215 [Acidobacteriota bacterium]
MLKRNRTIVSNVLVVAMMLALALPVAADEGPDEGPVESLWNDLVQWVGDLMAPPVASDPPPPEPDDEQGIMIDPHG